MFKTLAICAALLAPSCVWADEPLQFTLKDHKFAPAEVDVPAGKALTLAIANADGTPAEFESKELRVEKTIPAGGAVTLHVRALTPGRYRFFDDYNASAAEGFLNVK